MTQISDDRTPLFDALRGRLLSLAARVLGSRAEAEDVVQDAWFKWQAADADALRAPQAWLATVTVRLAIDRLRRLRRERTGDAFARFVEPWLDGAAPSAEEAGLRAARLSDGLRLLLDRLTPVEQAAFVLRVAFDCDYAEIAALTGCKPAHCRQIVHRAKERLARDAAREPAGDPVRHEETVERLREVLDAQDRAGLMQLFGAETAVAAHRVRTAPLDAEAQTPSMRADALTLDGEPGVALFAPDGELAAWLRFIVVRDERGEPFVCVAVAADTSTVERANRRFGGRAVRRLLAGIAAGGPAIGTPVVSSTNAVAFA
ncbi:sigma-70 family RNA polymerase sigma factor [Paraburkholderia caballeronis]|uniref:RNA polymerase sigma-70 factor, ECF subfamily n=1 Tax=Paraburkholderia caballeronis TaxID=416943 RepID=A0A1H7PLG3_9BURK|nr:sigma-70 family RNA polymerase sigma factor [Paraburkholderia caballeronis]PXW24233.1 RNA polymerase sigma-70 factor (ECF subfamily) [Paraburkholderia caballeronis]PXX00015.1 RNA polymerase sigma-70 factor (ECF subfamily) [Paraburkholderia caballeronis]RAJ97144.1 RNA polymerase sigma-70 factor (ECF subfamily) [Paraburkholderia caballeronis]SEB72742.1 RNA polymerase sigma-70 factor, ECF subfamily [Paraburkholderia caballeronis]SEL36602.1 RNA polymerase sigma-70 factor, ECF subfamily [Parabur